MNIFCIDKLNKLFNPKAYFRSNLVRSLREIDGMESVRLSSS